MSLPSSAALMAALEATWGEAAREQHAGWSLSTNHCGGKRISAARAVEQGAQIDAACDWMTARGLRPLFQLTPDMGALDADLAARGFEMCDPTWLYAAPVDALAEAPPPVRLFSLWPPLQIMREIWAEAGIGPARLEIMTRASMPKTALLARHADRPAGVAFVALAGQIAMLHALEVHPRAQRQGVGALMLRGAAHWAHGQGAEVLALAVTKANLAGCALYERCGMARVGAYHYRQAV